jgi:hypothetical protein
VGFTPMIFVLGLGITRLLVYMYTVSSSSFMCKLNLERVSCETNQEVEKNWSLHYPLGKQRWRYLCTHLCVVFDIFIK